MTHACATGPKYLIQFFKYCYSRVQSRARRSRYFFHRQRDDRTKLRKLLFRYKRKLYDKSHIPVRSRRRDLFSCQMVDGKMGKAFCFLHKTRRPSFTRAECLGTPTCWLLPGVAAVEMGKLREPGASRNPESAAVPRVLDNFQI